MIRSVLTSSASCVERGCHRTREGIKVTHGTSSLNADALHHDFCLAPLYMRSFARRSANHRAPRRSHVNRQSRDRKARYLTHCVSFFPVLLILYRVVTTFNNCINRIVAALYLVTVDFIRNYTLKSLIL